MLIHAEVTYMYVLCVLDAWDPNTNNPVLSVSTLRLWCHHCRVVSHMTFVCI
jgi:hypothetical protein